jgi:hypothetical protein
MAYMNNPYAYNPHRPEGPLWHWDFSGIDCVRDTLDILQNFHPGEDIEIEMDLRSLGDPGYATQFKEWIEKYLAGATYKQRDRLNEITIGGRSRAEYLKDGISRMVWGCAKHIMRVHLSAGRNPDPRLAGASPGVTIDWGEGSITAAPLPVENPILSGTAEKKWEGMPEYVEQKVENDKQKRDRQLKALHYLKKEFDQILRQIGADQMVIDGAMQGAPNDTREAFMKTVRQAFQRGQGVGRKREAQSKNLRSDLRKEYLKISDLQFTEGYHRGLSEAAALIERVLTGTPGMESLGVGLGAAVREIGLAQLTPEEAARHIEQRTPQADDLIDDILAREDIAEAEREANPMVEVSIPVSPGPRGGEWVMKNEQLNSILKGFHDIPTFSDPGNVKADIIEAMKKIQYTGRYIDPRLTPAQQEVARQIWEAHEKYAQNNTSSDDIHPNRVELSPSERKAKEELEQKRRAILHNASVAESMRQANKIAQEAAQAPPPADPSLWLWQPKS